MSIVVGYCIGLYTYADYLSTVKCWSNTVRSEGRAILSVLSVQRTVALWQSMQVLFSKNLQRQTLLGLNQMHVEVFLGNVFLLSYLTTLLACRHAMWDRH